VQIRELAVPDAFEVTPKILRDERGEFLEWYRFDELESAVGHALLLRQANTSVSKRGVIRGVHYADLPPGQAKYVTAIEGTVIDFVVDIRVGSPTFGKWDSVVLDDVHRRAVYLSEGLGHAFVAVSEQATVSYLVSDVYNPSAEHGIDPFDPTLALVFPSDIGQLTVSDKDKEAPSLEQAVASGVLPVFSQARSYYDSLRGRPS
jgi:dTDP-4-dehydrorhamnose 3,5-epimerase